MFRRNTTMNFVKRIILKELADYESLTEEQRARAYVIFKHRCIAWGFARLFVETIIPSVINFVLFIFNLVIIMFFKSALVNIVLNINLLIMLFITAIDMIIIYKFKIKKQTKQTKQEIFDVFVEKIRNLWLLNESVISFKDWKLIKERDENLYYHARSEACNHQCYFTSYSLANTLKNPSIKILWISTYIKLDMKCGHSVLVKDDKIYDSNLRRTYDREAYLKAFNAEVFKEYSIDEYINDDFRKQKYFDFLDWDEFGNWCKERGVIRDT